MTNYHKYKKFCCCILFFLVLYLFVLWFLPIVLPFLLALMISRMLLPWKRFLSQKLRFCEPIASVVSLLFFFLLFCATLGFLFYLLWQEVLLIAENFPYYLDCFLFYLKCYCLQWEAWLCLPAGSILHFLENYQETMLSSLHENLLPSMTHGIRHFCVGLFKIFALTFVILISSLLILKDEKKLKDSFSHLPCHATMQRILSRISKTGLDFLKAQAIIVCVIALLCSFGLWLAKNPYFLMLGILISLLDLLPIFGTGTVFFPWIIFSLLTHNFSTAAILGFTYAASFLARELLEPKLLAGTSGILPIYVFMSIYIGLCLFGFCGAILGPIALILMKCIIYDS